MARQAQAAPAKTPQQKNWASRHKSSIIGWSAIAVGAIFGIYGLVFLLNPE